MKLRLLLGILVALTTGLWGTLQMKSMEEVGERLKGVEADTLVIWDIDMVLIQPADPAFHMGTMGYHKEQFHNLFGSLTPDEQAIALSLIPLEGESELVESRALSILQDLRDREIPHMALTACLTGPLASCHAMEEQRIDRLRKLGISFADVAPIKETVVFDEMPRYRNSPVLFKAGILFANGVKGPKGDALLCFLKRCESLPNRIIFIDDRLHHLEDVEAKLSAFGDAIAYEGIHYVGAKHFPSMPVTEDAFFAAWSRLIFKARAIASLSER